MTQYVGGKGTPVYEAGILSGGNTTTTALGSSETFTGEWEKSDCTHVAVSCKTDAAGTLFFDFSNDATNADTFPSAGFDVAAGIHEFHTAVKLPRFFRVRLVNDAGAQSYLRLYTYFGQFGQGNTPLNQTLGADSDAIVTRSIPMEIDSALGRLGGITQKNKFGRTGTLGTTVVAGDTGSWEDLWAFGGLRTAPTTSFTPYVQSASAADTGVPFTVTYQDTGGDELEATVTLAGQTPTSLGITATEVYRGFVDGDKDAKGQITVVTDTGSIVNGVPANNEHVLVAAPLYDNQSQVLAVRIPADKTGILQKLSIMVSRINGSAGSADVVLQVRETGKVWRTIRKVEATTNGQVIEELSGVTVPALTDIRVRIRDVSDANTTLAGDLTYLTVDA